MARALRPGDRYLRGRDVRLISEANEQLGITSFETAMQRAQGAGLDLVEVAGKSEPPVCRIMDYGKFQYQQSKRQREAKKKQHLQKLKEVKFHPNIDPHDYQIKLNRIIAFVEKGFRVKVSMYFRGREMAHTDIGMHLMQQVAEDTAEVANTDVRPRRSGRMLLLMLSPKAH